jgi:hypothetical protein
MKSLISLILIALALSVVLTRKAISKRSHSKRSHDIFHLSNEKLIQKASHLYQVAYTPGKLEGEQFHKVKEYTGTAQDAYAILVQSMSHNLVVLSFRGTQSISNLSTDTDASQVDFHCFKCMAHKGFVDYVNNLKIEEDFYPLLLSNPSTSILITGHSLGGAAAVIFVGNLIQKYGDKLKGRIKLVTFGAPRSVDERAAKWIELNLGHENIIRNVFKDDLIPTIPYLCKNYLHFGILYFYTLKTVNDKESLVAHVDKNYQDIREDWGCTQPILQVLRIAWDHKAHSYYEKLEKPELMQYMGMSYEKLTNRRLFRRRLRRRVLMSRSFKK